MGVKVNNLEQLTWLIAHQRGFLCWKMFLSAYNVLPAAPKWHGGQGVQNTYSLDGTNQTIPLVRCWWQLPTSLESLFMPWSNRSVRNLEHLMKW